MLKFYSVKVWKPKGCKDALSLNYKKDLEKKYIIQHTEMLSPVIQELFLNTFVVGVNNKDQSIW